MPAQSLPLIITFTSVSPNSPRASDVTTKPTKEKNSQKAKITGTLSTKKAVVKAKRPIINDLVDDLINIMDSTFL